MYGVLTPYTTNGMLAPLDSPSIGCAQQAMQNY
jgi:hypothetical protein